MREFITVFAWKGLVGLLVPVEIVPASFDAVDLEQAHIEPYGRIESSVLVHAEPGKLIVEAFGVFCGAEIAVLEPSVGDRPADAVDELFYGGFSF